MKQRLLFLRLSILLFISSLHAMQPSEQEAYAFLNVVTIGDADTVLQMIDQNKNFVHVKDTRDKTALHFALAHGWTQLAGALVAHGADVTAVDDVERTPLHVAAHKNQTIMINVLIDKGADVNAQDKFGYTPLHDAIDNKHLEATKLLLQLGADPNAKTLTNEFPIVTAARAGAYDIMVLLASYGAHLSDELIDRAEVSTAARNAIKKLQELVASCPSYYAYLRLREIGKTKQTYQQFLKQCLDEQVKNNPRWHAPRIKLFLQEAQ